jgi:hypothetical protein
MLSAHATGESGSAAANQAEIKELVAFCPQTTTPSCIASHFESIYALAASGNKLAASVLYGTLGGCDLTATASRLAENPRTPRSMTVDLAGGTSHPNSAKTAAQDAASVRRVAARIAARCKYFTDAQVARQSDIGWLAASLGDKPALNNIVADLYGKTLFARTKTASGIVDGQTTADAKRTVEILRDLTAESPDADYYQFLSMAYAFGLGVPVDLVTAYGYKAASIVVEKASNTVPGYRFEELDALEQSLSPAEKARAQSLAIALTHHG